MGMYPRCRHLQPAGRCRNCRLTEAVATLSGRGRRRRGHRFCPRTSNIGFRTMVGSSPRAYILRFPRLNAKAVNRPVLDTPVDPCVAAALGLTRPAMSGALVHTTYLAIHPSSGLGGSRNVRHPRFRLARLTVHMLADRVFPRGAGVIFFQSLRNARNAAPGWRHLPIKGSVCDDNRFQGRRDRHAAA